MFYIDLYTFIYYINIWINFKFFLKHSTFYFKFISPRCFEVYTLNNLISFFNFDSILKIPILKYGHNNVFKNCKFFWHIGSHYKDTHKKFKLQAYDTVWWSFVLDDDWSKILNSWRLTFLLFHIYNDKFSDKKLFFFWYGSKTMI